MGEKLTPTGRRFIRLWAIGVILIFMLLTSYMAITVYENKQTDIIKHETRMNPNLTEPGFTGVDSNVLTNTTTRVITGVYVDQISKLSLSDSTWSVDFYIWFKWNGGNVNPGENINIVDGHIIKKVKKDDYVNGTEHYKIYYVTAEIHKFFDVLRFPVDNHVLDIEIEDEQSERSDLIYVVENNTYNTSSRVLIPGYKIDKMLVIEKPHTYKTNFGDPRLKNRTTTFSQLRTGIYISRPDLGFYLRIFIGLFVAVAAALLALRIKLITAVNARFGLGSSALFVALANFIVTSGLIPKTGIMTLADMVNDLGLILILMTLIESTVSYYLYDMEDEKVLSQALDSVSFILFLVLYIIINAVTVILAW